jgi:hypothetical protein
MLLKKLNIVKNMDTKYNEKNLDRWAIPREAFEWIYENLPHGSTILELGSGNGTKELVKYYNVVSIEQNESWVNLVPESKYIYAPLKEYEFSNPHSCWYDDSCLTQLPTEYDLLIIDGPIRSNRGNFVHFMEYFKKDIPYVIDDTNRDADKKMALKVAETLNKKIIEIKGWEKEMMILI